MRVFDAAPDVQVDEAEYIRLLGFPRGHVLEGRALELACWARQWYRDHGRPWIYARECGELNVDDRGLVVDGVRFTSSRMRRMLEQAGAHSVMLVAVSAGAEIEHEAHRAWVQDRPDEYFFLEMFGSAVVEHLTTMTGARLCAWADREGTAVLPHYSPGYPEWDISEQPPLLSLLRRDELPGPIEALDSGMLRPKKSLLALFGLTRHTDRVRRLVDLVPCENCSFRGCQFRRAPYRRGSTAPRRPAAGTTSPGYGINRKALQRWAAERLTLTSDGRGGIEAIFRYDGTTCSNMGRKLTFHYRVSLGPRDEGYPIRDQSCRPAEEDEGHRSMCEYLRAGERLLETVAAEKPLLGRPLDDVLSWQRPTMGAGCYCEAESRAHKWGLVLETIHYALARNEGEFQE
jgi:hypothetical protein